MPDDPKTPDTGNPTGKEGGTGGEGTGNPNPSSGGTPAETPPNQQPTQTPPATPPAPAKPVFTAEQQAEINRIAGEAREAGREAARREAESERLKSQGEFQKLYEAAKPEAEKVPALTQRVTELETRIHAQIDGEIAGWPEEVRRTDPGKDNLSMREQWIQTHRPLAERLKGGTPPPNPETGGGTGKGKEVKTSEVADNYIKGKYALPGAKPGG